MIYNEDCIQGAQKHIPDDSLDLLICDPPFGIDESTFAKHYFRDESKTIDGYVEAPGNYHDFSLAWIGQAKRTLKENGSMYIVSGWSNLDAILNAVSKLNLNLINHIIWKFNFGVFTSRKFVSSHYHILYLKKSPTASITFNTNCRFGSYETDANGGKLLYQDMQDVWCIKKEYSSGELKNKNKLPDELVSKMILYSSNQGDSVCDFFLGNFTTAIVAKKLGRVPYGFEINAHSYNHFKPILDSIPNGCGLDSLRVIPNDKPANQGLPITQDERNSILSDYVSMNQNGIPKFKILENLGQKYGRGRWGLERILKKSGNDKS